MKEGYKQTEIGEIPEEWEVAKLGDLVNKMASGGTPLISGKDYYGGAIPFAKIEDLTRTQKYVSQTEITISKKGLENSAAWVVPINSILYSIYATLGEARIAAIPLATNQAILAIIPKEEKLNYEFLFYYLNNIKYKLTKYHKETTQKNLTKHAVNSFDIPLPPLPEQKKIASVLSTVDATIEKTSEIIEQAKQLKKGLMQELLTRGIGHKKFKQTEIGEMPEEWEIIRLGELAEIVSGSTPSTNQLEYWGGSFAFVTPTDVTALNGKIYLEKTEKKLTEKGRAILSAKTIPAGSVLFTSRASVGFCAINTMPVVTNQGFANFICKDRVYNLFLYYLLSALKTRFEQLGNGSTFLEVSRKALKRTSIALPPLPEQKKIAEILGAADAKIEAEVQKREQLQTLKKGLMQDLLTGRVRFPEFVKGANS